MSKTTNAQPLTPEQRAKSLQARYAAHRRRWAAAVGRPYPGDGPEARDARPPPGELDAEANEE